MATRIAQKSVFLAALVLLFVCLVAGVRAAAVTPVPVYSGGRLIGLQWWYGGKAVTTRVFPLAGALI
jgi:cbb3-type cytochrome oxidase subunit 1